jgi:hypothetical protein
MAENIVEKDGVITNVLVTFFFYDSYEALYKDFPDADIEGISVCERNVAKNIAYCDVYQVLPRTVDGEHTLTLGHEVEHGIFGPEYHSEIP